MSQMVNRRRCVFVLGLVGASLALRAGPPGAAATTASLTGDRAGISIAHAVQRAFAKLSSYTVTEHRFVFMRSRAGAHGFFDWNWGVGTAPAGWVRATEHELVATHAGKVVWMRDNLTPESSSCSGHNCVRYPDVQVLVDRRGQYFRFARTRCYYRLTGTVPLHPGDPAYRIQGFMLDPGHQRNRVLLNYLYWWDSHRRAGETDVVSKSTALVLSGQVDLLGWGSEPTFIFAFALGYPHGAPVEPHVTLCRH